MKNSIRRTAAATLATAALTAAAVPAMASASSASTASAASRGSTLQKAVDQLVKDGQPGVIALSRKGDQVTRVTAGYADVKTHQKMSPELRFRIASVSKTFTTAVVLQLVAEHRISLDDTVARWLPGVLTRNGNDGRKITVRQLLGQTSGLNEYVQDQRVWQNPARVWKPRELVDIAQEKAPLSRPGAKWNYANTNFILAGMIVEKATGRPFAAELQRRIVRPLRLAHTFLPTSDTGFHGAYVHGYFDQYGDVSTMISPSSGWTSGGIVSTVDDVARFQRALVTGRLLPARVQKAMMTTRPVVDDWVKENYGLGLARIKTSCGFAWGHDGGWPGYRTWSYTTPDGRRQAVVTYNQSSPVLEAKPAFRADITKAINAALCR
ncbi:serine hydrolase domain-containing protein [Actinomadura rupiterrae]|uniref:serine hydrolase domain-containing protein n=1 Tax=Actinomadura rupiterrae TaxID=559627 RepID=UPI0020A3A6F1|nr:serine hydrolase domain-containing protein [Actinomadura rupiterrae]MCP2336382.1 D-alanyl-D-alanine carboxypeptidase [Actinomadura rupiterrae]